MPRTSRRSGAPTPAVSSPASAMRHRSPSPLSPHCISRSEEKEEMRSLNNRLASYIEKVQFLERERENLKREVSSIEEVKSTEVTTLRNNYDHEITKIRKALDDNARERAKYEIEADKLRKELAEIKKTLREKERAYDATANELRKKDLRLSQVEAENNQAQAELAEVRPEVKRLQTKLEDAKKNLEEETMLRVDVQNELQTKDESNKFEKQILEQQLNETKMRKQIELSEIDGRLSQEYDEKFAKALDEIRNDHDAKLAQHQANVANNYETKLKSLQDKLQSERASAAGSMQELHEYETKVTGLTSRNLELEDMNAKLQQRISDIMRDKEEAAKAYRTDLAQKDAELLSKEDELDTLRQDYEKLMEIKISLDREIKMYGTLLSQEETRLGTSPVFSGKISRSASGSAASGETPAMRGIKRKRNVFEEDVTEYIVESSSQGDIIIEPLKMNNKFIAVRNKSADEMNIGGWIISNKTDDGQETSYKFHRTTTLQPNDVCKVFSSDSGEEHSPPLKLVMKRGGWVIGERNTTILTKKDESEAAKCVTKKEHTLSSSVREGYMSHRDYASASSDKSNCMIM